jgi:hypothetical protein
VEAVAEEGLRTRNDGHHGRRRPCYTSEGALTRSQEPGVAARSASSAVLRELYAAVWGSPFAASRSEETRRGCSTAGDGRLGLTHRFRVHILFAGSGLAYECSGDRSAE